MGKTVTLASGVSVTFDGYTQWAGLQVSHDPSQYYLLVAAASMVIGLIGSLSVRRRRLWIKIAPASFTDNSSPTVVTVGGLARSDSGNFSEEFAGWFERLRNRADRRPNRLENAVLGREGVSMAINDGMAHLSDGLFTTAIATYTLAMIGYAGEYAFGRRGRVATSTPARQLVGAGAPVALPPEDQAPSNVVSRGTAGDRFGRFGRRRSRSSACCCTSPRSPSAASQSMRCRGATCTSSRPWWASSRSLAFLDRHGPHAVDPLPRPVRDVPRRAGDVPGRDGPVLAGVSTLVPALQSYWLAIHVTAAASRPRAS